MRIHTDLVDLGFQVVEIKNFGKPNGYIKYERISPDYRLYLIFESTGEITFNYYWKDQPRKLVFKIAYTDDEFLITEYLKHFIKEYTTTP